MVVVPVILAGGIGERFWPASRSSSPKQLLPLISSKMMIEETFDRVAPLCSEGIKPIIVTSSKIAPLIASAIGGGYDYDVIAEPVGKNTAPAVGAAAALCKIKYGDDAVMVVVSADHSIRPTEKFLLAAKYGAEIAKDNDTIVVFGIKPSRADTGYGYIELNGDLGEDSNGIRSFNVKQFVEKPDSETALKYYKSGNYLWNSGMFIWRTDLILGEFKNSMPSLFSHIEKLMANSCSVDAINEFYENCEKESIDFGIMENASSVSAVEGVFQWDDIGSWEAIPRINGIDDAGNCVTGSRVYTSGNSNCTVSNFSSHTVAVVGADDLLVVTVDDATLVIAKSELPNIKYHINKLKEDGKFPQDLF